MSPRKQRQQPGSSGGAYKNRSDLTQPVALPTGLPYGEKAQLAQAQASLPLPQTPPTPGMNQSGGLDPAVLAAAMHNGPSPADSLAAPSQRPFEPIQHGLASGPGAGPEALGQYDNTSQILNQLAQSTGNNALAVMAQRAQQYGM